MCGECDCESMGCHGQLYERRILTKAEKIKRLEDYAEDLKKEMVAVEERIKEMKT